jgi:exosortase family protein XrtM
MTPATTTPLGFAVRFVVGFAILMGAFEASRGTPFERVVVEDLILAPTTALINAIPPRDPVQLVERTLSSPGANLHVTRGCEGVEIFLLLVAAIVAFPATLQRRAQGLLWGLILAYVLSVARLMALHYVLRYAPDAWEALHGLVLPLGPLVPIALYFMRWSAASAAKLPPDPGGHAA